MTQSSQKDSYHLETLPTDARMQDPGKNHPNTLTPHIPNDQQPPKTTPAETSYQNPKHKILHLPLRYIGICVFSSLGLAILLSLITTRYFIHSSSPSIYQRSFMPPRPPSIWSSEITSQDLKTITMRNLFNREGPVENSTNEQKPREQHDGIVKSLLPLKLIGTVYGSNPRDGIAMIQNTDSKTINSFFVGSRLLEATTVVEIHRGKVIIDHQGQLEYIEKEDTPIVRRKRESTSSRLNMPALVERGVPLNSSGRLSQFREEGYEFRDKQIKMTESYKNKLLTQDFSKVLQDAKADPYLVNGKLAGFRLTRIRQDSIYEKSGFADGDIVTEINGIQLTSVSQAINVLQAARNASRIEVTVIQNGTPNVIEVTVGQ